MPSLKEINSTRKITSAMKMVASSKLHHAQTAIENMLPYENMLEHILKTFLVSAPDVELPFDQERPVKKVALIVFSSNSSLCGGFNANIIKTMLHAIEEYRKQGLTNDDIIIYPIGRKVEEKVRKLGLRSAGSFVHLADKPNSAQCRDISVEAGTMFLEGKVDKVELIYHHFKSAGSQVLTRRTFLPIDLHDDVGADNDRDLSSNLATKKSQEYLKNRNKQEEEREQATVKPLNDNFLVEPDLKTVLTELVPKELHLMVYTALLDSNASEHAARMVAMQTATDNADELLRELNLQYNKSRQAAITSELLDIVGGSSNN